ncbi:MAG: RHS repeat-associated core domain-containing [Actinobacteria bacterium]|nr:MAG: RHS repeat-associated core domain-containing [Actinomycetota bacterium]
MLALSAERSNGTTWGVTYVPDGAGRPWLGVYAGTETTVPVSFGILTTQRGDVTELIDANVVVFAYMTYDVYGNPGSVATTGTATIPAAVAAAIANANPLRYAGYCYDGFSGLYYCSQRYYDSATAQFITKDPAKADGEESAYQYCGGDPVGSVDPSGLRSVKWFTIWAYDRFVSPSANWREMAASLFYAAGETLKCRLTVDWFYSSGSGRLAVDWQLSWWRKGNAHKIHRLLDMGTVFDIGVGCAQRFPGMQGWHNYRVKTAKRGATNRKAGSITGKIGPYTALWVSKLRFNVWQKWADRNKPAIVVVQNSRGLSRP